MAQDGIDMRPEFWTLPLKDLTQDEWEALCDGCGKCCLNKLEDEDTGEVVFTRIACRLFDASTCRCANYANRKRYVPECLVLTYKTMAEVAYFMPETCAYRRRHEGKDLPFWHPLITGDPNSVHTAGVSAKDWALSEMDIHQDDWEDYVIEDPLGPKTAL